MLELGLIEPHIERIRAGYSAKMQAMLAAADEFLRPIPGVRWIAPDGGLYIWLTLPSAIERRARRAFD